MKMIVAGIDCSTKKIAIFVIDNGEPYVLTGVVELFK